MMYMMCQRYTSHVVQTILFFIIIVVQLQPVYSLLHVNKRLNRKISSYRCNAVNDKIILGVNKYSHDTSICLLEKSSGKVLFTLSKERITGKKNDGGSITALLEYALKAIGANENDIHTVVSNNHHFRVIPFEKRIPFYKSIKYVPQDYDTSLNLLPNARHYELSHHLAHAWSAVGTASFKDGLIGTYFNL